MDYMTNKKNSLITEKKMSVNLKPKPELEFELP